LPETVIIRPAKWLAGFEKVRLAPGARKTVRIALDDEKFQYYNTAAGGWRTEGGAYTVYAGPASNDLPLSAIIRISGDGDDYLLSAQRELGYYHLTDNQFCEADFAALYGKPLPATERLPGEPFTVNTMLGDIRHTFIGRMIIYGARDQAKKMLGGLDGIDATTVAMMESALTEMPLRGLAIWSGGALPPDFAEMVIAALNGNILSRAFATVKLLLKLVRNKK
jgi:beta-glucosidase